MTFKKNHTFLVKKNYGTVESLFLVLCLFDRTEKPRELAQYLL